MSNYPRNICPFCKKDNKCKHHEIESCWCMNTEIPKKLLKLLPNEGINRACICKDCITFYKKNREEFIKKYC